MHFISKNITLDSPYWLRESIGNFLLSYYYFLNIRHLRFCRFLAASQWFPRLKLEQYQTERLKLLLNHAYKNVPYYTEIFIRNKLTPDDFNSIRDLRKLPLLTKEDIIKNMDKLISRKIDKKYLFSISTSGTTGTPMRFYRDRRYEHTHFAFYQRMLASLGISIYRRGVIIWLRPFVLNDISDKYLYLAHAKQLTLATFHKGLPCWEEKLEFIRKFKPAYIRAGSSVLYDFACYLKEHNINDIVFECVFSSFENLFPHQRQLIEEQFKCKVYNYYVSQERVVSTFECLRQDGMHIDMERGVAEIIDDNGELLPDGKSGRIIATPLHIFAMPLIRYDTGDIGSVSEAPCPCGRGLPLLQSFDGRISEVIRYKDKLMCPSAFSAVLCKFPNIKECQFVQEKETEVVMNIVRRDGFSEDDAKRLIEYLHSLIDEGLGIKLNFVDHIPRTKMGKFQLVISKLG
jgi:phenylacetate-CoA ligase